ncbi:hypothetical protein A2U01_0051228, partial [Trifolium medium]|nr:hypothetical protein [Trifolium medium]
MYSGGGDGSRGDSQGIIYIGFKNNFT